MTGSMTIALSYHAATLLSDGTVLISGGFGGVQNGMPVASAERYEPKSGSFSLTSSMSTARADQTATLLSDGRVLITGGADSNLNSLSSAALYS